MKHIVVLYNSECANSLQQCNEVKSDLYHRLKANNFLVFSKRDIQWDLKRATYYFIDINVGYLPHFVQRQKQVDHIHAFMDAVPNKVESAFSSLFNMKHVRLYPTLSRTIHSARPLFSLYEETFEKITVYELNEEGTRIRQKEIMEYEYDENKHELKAEKAQARLLQAVEERILHHYLEMEEIKKKVQTEIALVNEMSLPTFTRIASHEAKDGYHEYNEDYTAKRNIPFSYREFYLTSDQPSTELGLTIYTGGDKHFFMECVREREEYGEMHFDAYFYEGTSLVSLLQEYATLREASHETVNVYLQKFSEQL